jgi:leader peptidase (prepilin peptidase)/N-methyltransferase
MDLLVIFLSIPTGLVVGGFVTMLVDRIPDKTPLTARSRCPFCEHPLAVHEIIPVVSWLHQRGRCQHCDHPITPSYPVVELLTMGLWVATALRFGAEWTVAVTLVLVTAVVALSVIDMYVYRLPDRLVFPSLLLSIVAIVFSGFAIDQPSAIVKALGAMALCGGFLLILHLISPKGMGFGDVKLALLLGVHLGWAAGSAWIGWRPVIRAVFYALLLSCLIGGIGGLLVAILRRRLQRDVMPDPEAEEGQPKRLLAQSMPFGPALAAGTVIVVLFLDSFV